jgi:hypothetical protein
MQLVLVIIMPLSEQERMKACGGIILDRLQLVLDIILSSNVMGQSFISLFLQLIFGMFMSYSGKR